jgi:hypothetical protein
MNRWACGPRFSEGPLGIEMQRQSIMILYAFSVFGGVSAAYFVFWFSDAFIKHGTSKAAFQHCLVSLISFLVIASLFAIPASIPIRFHKTLKAARFISAAILFVLGFLFSFVSVPEIFALPYSSNIVEKLPNVLCVITLTILGLVGAIILIWPDMTSKFLTKSSSGSLRDR